MDFEAVKLWFERWASRQARLCQMKGWLGLMLMPVALAAASTLVYWLLRLFSHAAARGPDDANKCLWIALALIPFMFIGNLLMPRRNLMEERMSGGVNTFYAHGAANRGIVLGHVFMWILFTGPRLLNWGVASLREATLWKQTDTHSCSAVLWMLVTRGRKVSFEDIQHELEWLNLEAVLPELKRVPGVLFLQTPPPGLTLVPEFRDSIKAGLP